MIKSSQMKKIAIIEDDQAISQMYRMKFEAEGNLFQVHIAENGQKGIEMVRAIEPDLILLDIRMPLLGGLEVLKQVRRDKKLAKTKIIILTNSGFGDTPEKARKLGVEAYIVKADLTPSQLVTKVKKTLNLE